MLNCSESVLVASGERRLECHGTHVIMRNAGYVQFIPNQLGVNMSKVRATLIASAIAAVGVPVGMIATAPAASATGCASITAKHDARGDSTAWADVHRPRGCPHASWQVLVDGGPDTNCKSISAGDSVRFTFKPWLHNAFGKASATDTRVCG